MIGPQLSRARLAGRLAGTYIGLTVLVCGLTLLFLGLDAALTGAHGCAAGRRGSCEVAAFVPVGILTAAGGLGCYLFANRLFAGPRIAGLVWPAAFLIIGFGFARTAVAEQDWGWAVPAGLFALIGLAPVAFWRGRTYRHMLWGPDEAEPRLPSWSRSYQERWLTPVRLPGTRVGGREAVPLRHDLVGELERLSALHRAGHLDDEEFAAAKARLLNGAH